MKVIVDIKNKTLKMLENDRAIFKGEYSADKLELYINQQLENEYPVITGLLSNGRRIGAFTTDDGYEMETIDDVEYTKAKFTLSKENGFPLSAGVTQITIWMYRTKDSVLVSKEAIGNVVFTVVDTTAFNDGDVIISGDVEGTVVNLKVEMENLQAKTEQYLPLNGGKPMTGDLSMKGNNIIFDNGNEETIEIGEEDNEYSMSIRMEDSDYYKGRYRASGFSIGNDYIDATLDISESRFTMTLAGNSSSTITSDGFSVSKEGSTYYEDGRVGRYFDDYSKHVEYVFPNKSGEFALKEDIPTKTSQLTNDSNYATTNQLFSKNYNDLTNKPSIPSSTSQLTNNSGFITNAVNNLTNYYLKSETYTKSEVQQLFSTISGLKLEVVSTLPTTNISSNTIYLKSLDSAKENNIYEEYIYINNKWETIGTTAVDLTNYALKTEIPTKLSELEQDIPIGGGLYTQYLKFSIIGDDDVTRDYSISLNTSKPITNLEEFRTYISNRLIYSDSPTFGVTFIHFMILTSSEPVYLAYSCAYYGAPTYTIQEIMTSNNSITNITEAPYISVVLDRMKDFEVLTTIKN